MWKSPKVRNMAGKDINSTIGFTKALMIPKIAPPISNSTKVPVKINPGTNLAAIRIAAPLAKILKINLIALFLTYINLACRRCAVKEKSYFTALLRPFIIISFSAKTFLPETFIFGFCLTSLFSAFVLVFIIWFNYNI